MSYFLSMSAVLGQNVTFKDHIPAICSAKVTNDECQYSDNKLTQEAISVNIRDIKVVNRSDMAHYKELKKGMKVRLKSGRELVVKEFCEQWAWCNDNSLPVHRSVIG